MSRAPNDDRGLHAYLLQYFPTAEGVERFVVAVALLTYGHLEVVDEILALIPTGNHPARVLARSVDELLPTGGDALRDTDAVRAWLENHRTELAWNETTGRFDMTV
jgi:hypothetical protein